jgi:hypothetical protein
MEKVDFMDKLPLSEACHTCGSVLRAADWDVRQCGPGEWLALCMVQCQTCGNLHIAAAGSTRRAQLDAQYVREKLFREIPKK